MVVYDSVTNRSFGRWPCEAGGCRSSLSEDEEEEKVHAEIEKANGYKKCQDIMIIMEDCNAKIGDERVEDVVGPSGIDLSDLVTTQAGRDCRSVGFWLQEEHSYFVARTENFYFIALTEES
ncbi:hypothetical protein PoB_001779700 [Plakobranchus ocellatus]|uniref:Uncharacterized protein n=1 Tax=Plakobranchus ocellatus TaxID=259542 RepID=A0AAV3Z7S2_9GAST|nr:hypothetical protein PoB_001779700 [Plakobranchus ocellatus]